MILDHIGLSVSDCASSQSFFTEALAPLGITLVLEVEGWARCATPPSREAGACEQTRSALHRR